MKNLVKLLFIVVLASSCNSDFIELTPFSQADAGDFYKTANDFEVAVNGVYDVLQDGRLYGSRFEIVLEVRSDNGQFNDPASNNGVNFSIDNFTELPDNSAIEGPYIALYQGISRANAILDRIDQVDIDVDFANRIKGETQFLRGLFYFHLVRLYGDVPLVDREIAPDESGDFDRVPVSEIYEFIEADLTAAGPVLPLSYGTSDKGRATQGAANGLLAKVYLTQGKFGLAKVELEKVINSNVYSLLPSVASVFSKDNELNEEIIFAVRYEKGAAGEHNSLSFDYTQNATIDDDLVNAYEPLDERLPLVQYVTVSGSRRVPQKYFDVLDPDERNAGLDIIVLRYADILLMYAEVLNEEGYVASDDSPAFQALNAVRERAGDDLVLHTTAELNNQVTFREAVLKERRLELALEFHRWYDLKRTGTAISTFAALGVTIQTCHLIYPIPKIAIDRAADPTNFPQNPLCN